MEKTKNMAKKPTSTKTNEKKKVIKPNSESKVEKIKKEKVAKNTQPVAEIKVEKAPEIKAESKKTTLNQELNLLIGLFSLITIITFCFAFQGGDVKTLGWEIVLKAGQYSSMFKWLMIVYVVAIFIDCILAIRIDTESEIFNIVEKALYMFTAISNAIVIAVLLTIIANVGLGLIIFFIISIISTIVKFARIYSKK